MNSTKHPFSNFLTPPVDKTHPSLPYFCLKSNFRAFFTKLCLRGITFCMLQKFECRKQQEATNYANLIISNLEFTKH